MKAKTLALFTCLLHATAAAFPARAGVQANLSIDLTGSQAFVPCAADGAGEVVVLEGFLHILVTYTEDAEGGLHGKYHHQPQGLKGIGLTTWAQYSATRVTQGNFNLKRGSTETYVDNFRIIGPGPGSNFLIHENTHITATPNGDVVAEVDNLSEEWK